jgi:Fur family transcriptional regulator, stress-responsive regulator
MVDETHAHGAPRLEAVLHGAGLKVTRGRVALLEALERAPHSDAESLFRDAGVAAATTSVQSVHNVLGDLTTAGLVRRIEPERSAALYERRIGDNHHHVVCRTCGAVADVDCTVGPAPCLVPNDTAGFVIDVAEVVFWGECAACRSGSAALAPQPVD